MEYNFFWVLQEIKVSCFFLSIHEPSRRSNRSRLSVCLLQRKKFFSMQFVVEKKEHSGAPFMSCPRIEIDGNFHVR